MQKEIIIVVLVALVAGGLGFFGGMQYGQNKTPQFAQMMQNGAGQYGAPTRGGQGARTGKRGGAVVGNILSIDNGTITVKLTNGSSKIIDVTGSTTYEKSDTAAVSDLKVGDRVAAFGAANSDGSVTATNVQINPGTGMMRPTGTASQSPSQPAQ